MFLLSDRTIYHIDNLININSEYLKHFNLRLKANKFFNEFDNRAREDLMTLIKLSQERYKSVKTGNDLDIILNKQRENFEMILNQAQNEELYNTSAISEEKGKFIKIRNKNRNKELIATRAGIRENGFASKLDEKFKQLKPLEMTNQKTLSSGNNFGRRKSMKSVAKSKFNNWEAVDQENSQQMFSQEHLLETNKQYSDFLEDDMKKFDLKMDDYYRHLNDLKQCVIEGENSKFLKNFTFITDDINMLSYKPKVNSNVVKISDTDFKLDLQKLMKLSKRFKNKIAKNNENSLPPMHSEHPLNSPNKFGVGKGISITKKEIMNLRNLEDILNKKRNFLNKYVEENGLNTRIQDYENIFKNNKSVGKISHHVTEDLKNETEENYSNKNKLDLIKSEIKKTFEETKKEWKRDGIQQQKLEKLEKERRILNRNFLNEIKSKPKFLQKFVDPYSIRDDILKSNYDNKKKKPKKLNDKLMNSTEKYQNEVNVCSTNEIYEGVIKNIVTESEDNEDGNDSIVLGGKSNEIITHVKKSASQPSDPNKVYQEFQEYKKIIIEKEKDFYKEADRNLEEKTRKYIEMIMSNSNSLIIHENINHGKPEKTIKTGTPSNYTASYFRKTNV